VISQENAHPSGLIGDVRLAAIDRAEDTLRLFSVVLEADLDLTSSWRFAIFVALLTVDLIAGIVSKLRWAGGEKREHGIGVYGQEGGRVVENVFHK
jgi:hypothetical protein